MKEAAMIRSMLIVSSMILLATSAAQAADTGAPVAPAPSVTVVPVPRAAVPSEPALTGTVSPELEAGRRRVAIAKDLREISIKYLGSLDPAIREKGRILALKINDPLAVDTIVQILGPGDENSRTLEAEMLGQIDGPQSSAALAKIIITDVSEPVRLVAIKALKTHTDKGGIQPLMNALRGTGDTYMRAAYALGDVGDLQTALTLVSQLRRAEARTVEVMVTPKAQGFFSGTITPYIAGGHAVAAPGGGAVAWAPEVGYTSNGVGMGNTNPQPVLEKRQILVQAEQPAIREAMKKITGQDFEYDVTRWRTWLGRAIAAEKAGQPMPGPEAAGPPTKAPGAPIPAPTAPAK
jgi:hypothetical protein